MRSAVLVLPLVFQVQASILHQGETKVEVLNGTTFTFFCPGSDSDGGICIKRNGTTLHHYKTCLDQSMFHSSYQIRCYSSPGVSVYWAITIPAEQTNKEHNIEWACCICNDSQKEEMVTSRRIKLQVIVPLTQIQLTEVVHMSSIHGYVSNLTCKAKHARPAADIEWIVDGKKAGNSSLLTIVNVIRGNDSVLYTTESTLRLMGNLWNQYTGVHCQGRNREDMPVVRSVAVGPNRISNVPHIEGYSSGYRLLETDPPLQLSCKVQNTSLTPDVYWNCHGYGNHSETTTKDSYVTSNIQIEVKEELDGKSCSCVSQVGSFRGEASVTFVVLAGYHDKHVILSFIEANSGAISVGLGIFYTVLTTIILAVLCRRNNAVRYVTRKLSRKKTPIYDEPRRLGITRRDPAHKGQERMEGYDSLTASNISMHNAYMCSPVV